MKLITTGRLSRGLLISALGLGALIGVASGVGAYTFIYARGASYMTNDPLACVNCHVMRDQYDGWIHSSHHTVAVCNDCHTPHNFFGKWLTKGLNGWHHSVAFTSGRFSEPIRITERNRRITEQACRYCHEKVVQEIDSHGSGGAVEDQLDCIRCHDSVGHMH